MMAWLYRIMMAVGMIGAALVTAEVLPASYGVVAAAVTGAAALFHDTPGTAK